MKQRYIVAAALICLSVSVCPSLLAEATFFQVEGVGVIAAASINPPDPVEGCNKAKQNAKEKAASAGFKGRAEWDRLSRDSDCTLDTQGGGSPGMGYYFIFKARGKIYK